MSKNLEKCVKNIEKSSKISINVEKTNKYVKKAVRNIKIKRKTGNKPSQISKNRQKYKKNQ